MKNKSAVYFALGFVFLVSTVLYAASGVRGAKGVKVITHSASATPVSSGPTAVYAVILGTGAVTDYIVLLDSANATAATATATGTSFRGRFYPSSATANTSIVFDPPLQFNNGVTAVNATALGSTAIISYEQGRVTQGY